MKVSLNVFIQLLSLVGQGATVLLDVVPPSGQKWVVGTLAVVQGTTSILAHFKNPDGTSAKTAYKPPQRR